MKVRKFGKNIVVSDGSLRQSIGKDQWNCYCDLQVSLHQMCVLLWANGTVLLKISVHSSNIEYLVVLAEKKLHWNVSMQVPKSGDFNIQFLGFLFRVRNHPNVRQDSFTSTWLWMIAYDKFLQYLINFV